MKDFINKQVEDIISNSDIKYTQDDIIIKLTEIILFNNNKDTDLLVLSKNIDFESLLKVLKLFSNKTIKFPDYEKVKYSINLALIYYYKDMYSNLENGKVGLSWKELEDKLGIDSNIYKHNYLNVKKTISSLIREFKNKVEK
jgi:hypothetical protein